MDDHLYYKDVYQAIGAVDLLLLQGETRGEVDLAFMKKALEVLAEYEDIICGEE
jgi:hypothetical protein